MANQPNTIHLPCQSQATFNHSHLNDGDDDNDDDEDSFDVSSLLPPNSPHPHPPSCSSDLPYSNLDSFLNSNHDHPSLLRHLNQLAPSPHSSFQPIKPSSPINSFQPNHSSSSSASAHDTLPTLGPWRMGISSDRVPTTLLEETSCELRQSEIDTDSSKLDSGIQDEADVSQDGSSDQDKSSTIYAGHSPPTQSSPLDHTHRRDHSTSIRQPTSLRRNPHGLENHHRHTLAENIGQYSSQLPPLSSNSPSQDPNQVTQTQHFSKNSDGHHTVDHSASLSTRSRASYFFQSARKYWLGSTTATQHDVSKLDDSNAQTTPATTPIQASPAHSQKPSHHLANKTRSAAQQRQTSARVLESASLDDLPTSMDSTVSGNLSQLDPFATILTNVNPSNEPSHQAYDFYQADYTQPDMLAAPVDQTPSGSTRPSSAPPFNKTPSFISFDRSDSTLQPGQLSPDPAQLPNPSRPSRRPVQSTPASKLHYTQESPLPLPAATPSNPAPPGSRANPPWLASLVKTPSKLQFSFVPSSPSNTTFSEHNQSTVGAIEISQASVTPGGKYGSPRSSKFNPVGPGSPVVQRPASAPTATPRNIQLRREYERKFLHSPLSARGSPRSGPGSTSGEARILYQSHHTTGSIASQALEGQSWSRLQDQTFSLLTPNQSFGMEFASPVGIRDWSIEHPSREECQAGQECHGSERAETDTGVEMSTDREDDSGSPQRTSNESPQSTTDDDDVQDERVGQRAARRGKVAVHTWHPDETVELSYTGMALVEDLDGQADERRSIGHPTRQPSTDASIFGPRSSPIVSLPQFSPLVLPQPRQLRTDPKPPPESTFRAEDSPLAVRTHGARPGAQASCLAESVAAPRPMPTCPSLTTPFLEPWNRGADQSESPEHRPAVSWAPMSPEVSALDSGARNDGAGGTANPAPGSPTCPPSPALSMVEASVYYSPDTSLVEDAYQQPQSAQGSRPSTKVLQIDPRQSVKAGLEKADGSGEILASGSQTDGGDRYRLMISITENLKRDLSIKEQMISLLEQDKSKALRATDQAQEKMRKMKERVKVAAREQRMRRMEQSEMIGRIVRKLKEEIEVLGRGVEEEGVLERDGDGQAGDWSIRGKRVERLKEGLEAGRAAIESLQPLLDGHAEQTSDGREVDGCSAKAQAEKIERYEQEVGSLRAQLAVFQSQADAAHRSGSEDGAEASETKLVQLEAAHAEHVARAEAAQALSDGRVAQLEQTLEATAAQARAWQARVGELEGALEAAQVAHDGALGRLRRAAAEAGRRDGAEVRQMADRIAMLEEEARCRLEAMGELRTQRRVLEERLEDAKTALGDAKREHGRALDELVGVRAEMETSAARIAELEGQRGAGGCGGCEAKEIKVVALEDERRLMQQKLAELRAQSANGDVKIGKLRKLCDQLKGDIQGLNIALEAKQQENGMLKRERQVRETGMSVTSLETSTTRSVLSRSAVRRLSTRAGPASAAAGFDAARPSLATITNGSTRRAGSASVREGQRGAGKTGRVASVSEAGSEGGGRGRQTSVSVSVDRQSVMSGSRSRSRR